MKNIFDKHKKAGRYEYLVKNVGLLTLSNFGSKILSFILIPLYTSELSTAEYGIYDLCVTTVSLAIPVLTLNILDAVLRFSLDGTNNPKDILSIGIKYCLRAAILFYILIILNKFLGIIDSFATYWIYIVLYMTLYMLFHILSQFTRGLERISDIAIAGVLNSITMLALNICFLKVFNWGLDGYFMANCIAYAIPLLFLAGRVRVWNYISIKQSDIHLDKEMISYSKPLVFNTIAWWINNASDRYVVTLICGVTDNGIYSVAYKIPSILNIVQTIFSQAWTLSAVKEFDEKNSMFYKNIYSSYNVGIVLVCSGLIMGDKILAKILFANEFYAAWKYAPWLMISVVFGSLSGVLGGIFTASKKTKVTAHTTIVGASVNTVLNFILVYAIGPSGAAIATLISYILVWSGRYRAANRLIKMEINIKRDMISYGLLIGQAALMILITTPSVYVAQAVSFIVLVVLYYKECIAIANKVFSKVRV